jgi:hypothetical protein
MCAGTKSMTKKTEAVAVGKGKKHRGGVWQNTVKIILSFCQMAGLFGLGVCDRGSD